MYRTSWPILVVDDEPDVLAVTQMALRGVKVYGVPLQIHTATSKAGAIEILQTTASSQMARFSPITVAFIDVVMETDQAGLELCDYIRNTLHHKLMQIYVRTGQPGVAPERAVIDKYDINGYLAKGEATAEKLYTMVKTGVELNYLLSQTRSLFDATHALIAVSDSRAHLAAVLNQIAKAFQSRASGERADVLDVRVVALAGDQVIGGGWGDRPEEALEVRDRLGALPGRPMGTGGDKIVVDGRDYMIHVAASEADADFAIISRTTAATPEFFLDLMYSYTRSLAALWKRAGSGSAEALTAS